MLGARLGLGVDPGDRDLVQVVARGEVAERRVARDEVAPGAVCEPVPVDGVERKHPRGELVRLRGPAEGRADPLHDAREQDRVEPDVRVGLARLVADTAAKRHAGQHVDALALGAVDCLLDRGLEPVREVEHDVGGLDAGDVSGVTSMSCGSAPGGVRFSTSTFGPPTCLAAKASG